MKNIINFLMCAVLLSYTLPAFSLANPASVNCANQGFTLVLIKSTGICIFPDGTYCEEWSFYRGNCTKGTNTFPGGKFDKKMISKYCLSKDKPPVVQFCK